MERSSKPASTSAPAALDPAHARRVEHVFHAAIEIGDAAARAAFLASACEGDAELRGEVEGLLRAAESPGFLASQPLEMPRAEQAGDRIDRYRLLQEIGAGGFGTVWMAEQVEPVARRVALKIIKLGMDTREVVARFEQERQALALMDHPHIAHVFDAGATVTGRPYFVMELVKGVPITQFCDERQFGARERLALFGDVCSAIHHAHQKGIIHRDIKPSNVMVTLHGDKAVVKVIDFGIAKATQGRLTDKTLFTRFEQFVGTPAYMSPEQAVLSGLDVDTRSDIYALGILLYELLTGKPPFDTKTLAAAGYEEMRRIIREEEPPKPSARLSTIAGEERTTVARARHVDPSMLGRVVEPELDWIVMKAIEKDRSRRYETANGLLLDVEHFLADEPVSATPPGASYRFRKFARRYRRELRLAAAVAAMLVVTTLVSVWLAIRASDAERTQRQARVAADEARARAETSERLARAEATKSAQSARFIQSMLLGFDPDIAAGSRSLLMDMLMRALGRVEAFRDQPEVAIEVLETIGHGTARLGYTSHAREIARRAMTLGARTYGPDSPRTARLMTVAATRSCQAGQHAEAEALATRAVEIQRRASGAEHRDTLAALSELGAVLIGAGKPAAAEDALRGAMTTAMRVLSVDDACTIECRVHLARALSAQRRHAEAEPILREAVASYERTVGGTADETTQAALLLLEAITARGGAAEGTRFAREFVQRLEGAKAEHCEAVRMMHELARILLASGQDEEGGAALRRAVEMAWRVLGPTHALSNEIARELSSWYVAHNMPERALALASEAVAAIADPAARFEAQVQALRTRLRVDPADAETALGLAARQAWLGRTTEWRDTVIAILDNVRDSENGPSAERAAKAAMIVPGADPAMLERARQLARKALEWDPGSVLYPWFELCAGMVEFRAGNDEGAETILARIDPDGFLKSVAAVPIYRALAAIRTGRLDDARALLADAERRMRPLPTNAAAPLESGGNHDDIIDWLAWNEAQALLKARK